jgi:hypothetical protein
VTGRSAAGVVHHRLEEITKMIAALVNLEDASLIFINQSLHEAQMIVNVSGYEQREFLLIFSKLGVYVDAQGLFLF